MFEHIHYGFFFCVYIIYYILSSIPILISGHLHSHSLHYGLHSCNRKRNPPCSPPLNEVLHSKQPNNENIVVCCSPSSFVLVSFLRVLFDFPFFSTMRVVISFYGVIKTRLKHNNVNKICIYLHG